MYDIKLLDHSDKQSLVDFIERCWKKNHVFVLDTEILDFQHKALFNYNFVGAFESLTGVLRGVLGFVSPSFYSTRVIERGDDIWLAIWTVDKTNVSKASIGFDLLDFLKQRFQPSSISAIGINRKVAGVYRLLGYSVGELSHLYLLNPKVTISKVGCNLRQKIETLKDQSMLVDNNIVICQIDWTEDRIDTNKFVTKSPKKDFSATKSRYKDHPTYKYHLYGIRRAFSFESFFVAREITVKSTKILRIVDFFQHATLENDDWLAFANLLFENNYEYIDIVTDPHTAKNFICAGFIENEDNQYVPHLFEPFDPAKSVVLYAYFGTKNLSVFKGDSDLDRPNLARTI